ncbi:MAG TPA: A/G-specific adenine glycosylase [Candidatus Levybacteria bacterium]|nr:A/G-specific adenine glycosylase [Candidatus Levybacteria bacterium]
MKESIFKKQIWHFYAKHKRVFPWRKTINPYHILVSEVMLQQTQTERVLPKYKEFLDKFPTLSDLEHATYENVLRVWSGLGYNRRALYLKKIAEITNHSYLGKLPLDPKVLKTFSGIGVNTAGAIYVFSTNKPFVFIETNIRRVFIHTFFMEQEKIPDEDILTVIKRTLDYNNPREWYYALMDYGVYLRKVTINPNHKSKHYLKQTVFEGSRRQIRGAIIKILLATNVVPLQELERQFTNSEYFKMAITQLEEEGFIIIKNSMVKLTP